MPPGTDVLGLGLAAAATAAVVLRLPGVARGRKARPARLLIAALVIALIPLGTLPVAAYVRGVVGDLSVTSMLLLLHGLFRPVLGWEAVGARSRLTMQALVAAGGLLLYPLTLGLGPADPYRLGFANPWFVGALLLLATAAWLLRLHAVATSITLAVLAWALGAYESRNLWDYLLDPLVSAWGLGALLTRGARAVVEVVRK
ncbi:MAG TPA: hypothetical protein VL691_05720 [Vicinamibacteria bacterium]|nr:hypothetical protein [Vicinamibacteria bacterium]